MRGGDEAWWRRQWRWKEEKVAARRRGADSPTNRAYMSASKFTSIRMLARILGSGSNG
jgi:hypothetical protein